MVTGVWNGLESPQLLGMCWPRPALPPRALGTCWCGPGRPEAVEHERDKFARHWKACVVFVSGLGAGVFAVF